MGSGFFTQTFGLIKAICALCFTCFTVKIYRSYEKKTHHSCIHYSCEKAKVGVEIAFSSVWHNEGVEK